ncbi:MAG: pilus assembly protein PilM [Xanthomonadaceae bacterium]|nr:pilus assembly protein PilM [Rhodospirillaceae bacterium]NIA17640.1 pilus assembly protein PilM [Xanthomonadaceae bacterium]
MSLFSSDYSYLGINLGTSSVKLVELANNNGVPHLLTYGFTEQSIDIIKDDSEAARREIVRILKQLCNEAQVSSNKVITALPTFSVFSSVISMPRMSKKDLSSAVLWEAKKIIPMPFEDIILDWYVLNEDSNTQSSKFKGFFKRIKKEANEEKKDNNKKDIKNSLSNNQKKNEDIKILLTGAPKNLVTKYIDIFQRANLNLLSLETEIFALIRALVGNDKSTLIIVDMGAASTNISLVKNGSVIINRSIELGGKNVTSEISQNLNVAFERAEQFKFDIGINAEGQADSSIFKSIESTMVPIVDEIKYTIDFFKNQLNFNESGNNNIEKIILTGGSSSLTYLPEYLSKKLNKKVYIGDPMARVIYPDDLKSIIEEIGSKLSVSVGLAMREIV